MFGIGTQELLLILAVALIVIGPKKLPDLAKSLGRAMGEFKRATTDLKQSIEQETGLSEVRSQLKEVQQDLLKPQTPSESDIVNVPPVKEQADLTTDTDKTPEKTDHLKDEEQPLA